MSFHTKSPNQEFDDIPMEYVEDDPDINSDQSSKETFPKVHGRRNSVSTDAMNMGKYIIRMDLILSHLII